MNIRNFVIIAHIDHGKSTLADRLLEITGTVESRQMKPQYLDQLELERERGITIKMAPVRMIYDLNDVGDLDDLSDKNNGQLNQASFSERSSNSNNYILNLIDTPGHPDFSYEVSRALAAVEGAILLVDGTQGIQAQTLANLRLAQKAGLKIICAVNKIDMNPPQLDSVIDEIVKLIKVRPDEIFKISGKTGVGVKELLAGVIEKVPPPKIVGGDTNFKAMIFNSFYDDHQGIIASIRVFEGSIRADDEIILAATNFKGRVKSIGYFTPALKPAQSLEAGEMGYLVTGLKDPEKIKIGDTVFKVGEKSDAYSGYKEPHPVVFVSFYPEDAGLYEELRTALFRLRLSDSSFQIEPDYNEVLGRGYRLGFLGRLHFEVTAERLEREFNLRVTNSFPSVAYRVTEKGQEREVKNPKDFPDNYDSAKEPMVELEILTPITYMGSVMNLKEVFRWQEVSSEAEGDRAFIKAKMPLAELVSDFDDRLRSASQGYASFNYELSGWQTVAVNKLEVLINGDLVPGLTRVVPASRVNRLSREIVEKLKDLLPKQQFVQALQVRGGGRILARETIAAMRKDVTGYLYGGDRTRKMKLWKKQKAGKEKLKEMGKVRISPDVFNKLLKSGE